MDKGQEGQKKEDRMRQENERKDLEKEIREKK